MTICQIELDSRPRSVYAEVSEEDASRDTPCILRVGEGIHFGRVTEARSYLADYVRSKVLCPVVRRATPEDVARRERHRQLEMEAFDYCREQAGRLGLKMRMVAVEMLFDESRFMFYYTAEQRVDFRELVKILAHRYRTRIEMRQIGPRDEAQLSDGYGHCGMRLCCCQHLTRFQPVTIRMAKRQGLSLNSAKISGACGRLMCCLRFEQGCPLEAANGNGSSND
ncbi:MAG: regulatory iron-sulfur-containing complex subunit RicT [Acidobacteriota bacterium]|jgi:cell fate regulator YaaT (PSP1 superfamily)